MTVDFETKCEQTALDYIKIHLQEGYLVTAYKDVGNYYWESVYKIRASLSTNRKTENSSEKPNNSTISKMEQVEDEPQTDRLVQINVIELPDTHQKVVFEREITEEDDCIKIGEWKYKGFEEE